MQIDSFTVYQPIKKYTLGMCKLTRLESIKRIQFAVIFFLVIKTKSFHSLGFNNEKVYQNYASYQNDQNVPKNDD